MAEENPRVSGDSAIVRELKRSITANQVVTKTTSRLLWVLWIVAGLIVWQYFMPLLIPRPLELVQAFQDLWFEKGIAEHLYNTFSTQILAMAIAIVLSLTLAYSSRFPVMRPLVIFVTTLRFISPGPLVVFLLLAVQPDGETLKLMLFVFAMTVWYLTSMTQVVDEVPITEYRHAYTLRMTELQTVKEVVILGRLHAAWEMLRQNTAMMWAMVPMVESLIRSGGGIGMLYANENKHFKLADMLAIIVVMLVYGLLMDLMFRRSYRLLFPYTDAKVGGAK